MTQMHYKSGERDFRVNKANPFNGYYKVQDIESKVKFKLPIYVINEMKYIFSWHRYKEERDNVVYKQSLENELQRLNIRYKTLKANNIKKGIEDMKRFLKELEGE